MTAIALSSSRNVIDGQAQRILSVMAGGTPPCRRWISASMVKCPRRPRCRGRMTGVALSIIRRNMRGRHGLRILRHIATAMTTLALAVQTRMVHGRGRPIDKTSGVTRITLKRRRYMAPRFCQRVGGNISAVVAR